MKKVFTLKSRGFTLIELLVVVLIIGILSAVALPQYRKSVFKAQLVQGDMMMNAYKKAVQAYLLANGGLPSSTIYLSGRDSVSEFDFGENMTSLPDYDCVNNKVRGYSYCDSSRCKITMVFLNKESASCAGNNHASVIVSSTDGKKWKKNAGISSTGTFDSWKIKMLIEFMNRHSDE